VRKAPKTTRKQNTESFTTSRFNCRPDIEGFLRTRRPLDRGTAGNLSLELKFSRGIKTGISNIISFDSVNIYKEL